VIDIGTGDGRFVSATAGANSNKFFIGIDANVKPLEKPSMKATRKPAKGGLRNALFVQASVEDLPSELDGIADEIHLHFPWGSLLKAVMSGEVRVLRSLRKIATVDCLLEIVIGIDPDRDRSELERLGLLDVDDHYLDSELIPRYKAAGFELVESGSLEPNVWSQMETSWARRLSGNESRQVTYFVFKAISNAQIT